MSNLRQAATLALEALKCGDTLFYPQTRIAISALIEALAEPEQEPVAWMYDCGNGGRMYAEELDGVKGWMPLYTAPPQRPAELEQEPVAYYFDICYDGKGKREQFASLDFIAPPGVTVISKQPLYTAPPQRLPLTDEHPLMVFAKECVLGAYSEKELADAANRAIKYAHSFKVEA